MFIKANEQTSMRETETKKTEEQRSRGTVPPKTMKHILGIAGKNVRIVGPYDAQRTSANAMRGSIPIIATTANTQTVQAAIRATRMEDGRFHVHLAGNGSALRSTVTKRNGKKKVGRNLHAKPD